MPAQLLSVVVPTHNRATSLSRAIRSVLDQRTEAELEVVVVDDGSTDDTPAVLQSMAEHDRRLVVVRNERPSGPGGARNIGIDRARGELLSFCDDDDCWLPGAAEELTRYLAEHSDVGGVSSWHEVEHESTGRAVVFRGPLEVDDRLLLWHYFVPVPFGVLRRSAYAEDPRFDPVLPTCEDWDLWLRCASEQPFRVVPRCLYRYRQHPGSRLTARSTAQVEGRGRFLKKHRGPMTDSCALYHETIIARLDGGGAAAGALLARTIRRAPADTAFVGALYAASWADSRVGIRRGDPGLPARTMARLIRGHERLGHTKSRIARGN